MDTDPIQCEGKPVTGMQCGILQYLSHEGLQEDIFQKDVEEKFQIRRSTATGILQLMEKNNMIQREAVPYDARLKKLSLTPAGVETSKKVKDRVKSVEEKLSKNLTEEEVEVFLQLIHKISQDI